MTNFVSHSFSCFDNFKLNNTITMTTVMASFDLAFFFKLAGEVHFVDIGNKVFDG